MVINVKKSFVIHFGQNNNKYYPYNVNGLLLDSKEIIRDLGILVDKTFKLFGTNEPRKNQMLQND
jgi:hypothetical protein